MTDLLPTESPDELLPRVTETQKLQDQAAAVHDQAIRDAKAAGHPMTQIAAALGITNPPEARCGLLRSPPKGTASVLAHRAA